MFDIHDVRADDGTLWLSSRQVLTRYGGRSAMWLWRKVKQDPSFPRPVYFGRLQFYRLDLLEEYERRAAAGTRYTRGETSL